MSNLARHREEVEFFKANPGKAFDESARAQLEYIVESYKQAQPDIKNLIADHYEEIALDKDVIKLDPDWEQYECLARQGVLHICTARDDGWLVGYHVSTIRRHLHYKNSLTCFTDLFYLRPEYRAAMTGYYLLKFFRDSVKAKGVQRIYMSTKVSLNLGVLFRRLGFNEIEHCYTLVIT